MVLHTEQKWHNSECKWPKRGISSIEKNVYFFEEEWKLNRENFLRPVITARSSS